MRVAHIWRFPVKSLQGESIESVRLGPEGIAGDRRWAIFDVESGCHLTARRAPELLFARAEYDEVADRVRVRLPDGSEADDTALSEWLGRSVRLQRAQPGMVGRFETQADASETGGWIEWEGPTGSFHDLTDATVSLVDAADFGPWAERRFRLNVTLECEPGAPVVDGLAGRRVRIGSARLAVTAPINRCVMTTRPQPVLDIDGRLDPPIEKDRTVLQTIVRGRGGTLGVGALVVDDGEIGIGDVVVIE